MVVLFVFIIIHQSTVNVSYYINVIFTASLQNNVMEKSSKCNQGSRLDDKNETSGKNMTMEAAVIERRIKED